MATIKRFEEIDAWKVSREMCKKIGDLIDCGQFKNSFKLIGQIDPHLAQLWITLPKDLKEEQEQSLFSFLVIQKAHVESLGRNYTGLWTENI